jgi:LPS export ABC transporter protein LptC
MGLAAGLMFSTVACRTKPDVSVERRSGPEQRLYRFSVESLSGDKKNWHLESDQSDIYESRHEMSVVKPHVRFFKNGELSSTLTAGSGLIQTESKDMWLGEGMVLESTSGVRLSSDWMNYYEAAQKITSTAPVTIVRPGSVTRGDAWEAKPDMSEMIVHNQRVELISQRLKR